MVSWSRGGRSATCSQSDGKSAYSWHSAATPNAGRVIRTWGENQQTSLLCFLIGGTRGDDQVCILCCTQSKPTQTRGENTYTHILYIYCMHRLFILERLNIQDCSNCLFFLTWNLHLRVSADSMYWSFSKNVKSVDFIACLKAIGHVLIRGSQRQGLPWCQQPARTEWMELIMETGNFTRTDNCRVIIADWWNHCCYLIW